MHVYFTVNITCPTNYLCLIYQLLIFHAPVYISIQHHTVYSLTLKAGLFPTNEVQMRLYTSIIRRATVSTDKTHIQNKWNKMSPV
jgi:hypothetical protein